MDEVVMRTTEQDHRERMLRVLVYIQSHLDDPLSLDDLAGVAHFSPFHFHRIFRGMVGESVKEHVRRLRLERAAQRLKLSRQSVTHIAFDAGYETHESFTRAFRAMFKLSPTGYRERYRSLSMPGTPSGVHYAQDHTIGDFQPCHEGARTMDVRIESLDPKRVAFMRHVGPYNDVGPTWGQLCAWAGPRGLLGPRFQPIGLCHDDPDVTPPDKVRYDACIPVDEGFEAQNEVGVQTIAGGEYAVVVHRGPYEKLNETYAALCGQWLPGHGREPASAPAFEVYRNDPQTTAPEDLVTDVCVPLKPR